VPVITKLLPYLFTDSLWVTDEQTTRCSAVWPTWTNRTLSQWTFHCWYVTLSDQQDYSAAFVTWNSGYIL
jgi:hypothetical protein